jgi:hypothetical protein
VNSADQPSESVGVLRRFFSNPIVGVVGAVASIIGAVLTVYYYKQAHQYRELTYTVNPTKAVVVKAGQSSQLSVTYKGQKIKSDVTAVQMVFWNAGNQSIRGGEPRGGGNVLKPLVITTGAPILEAQLRKASRDVTGITLGQSTIASGELMITWDILEQDDGGVVQIILAGDTETNITANAIIEGQKEIISAALQKVGKWRTWISFLWYTLMALYIPYTLSSAFSKIFHNNKGIFGHAIRYSQIYLSSIFLIILFVIFIWFTPLFSPEPPLGF